MNSNYELLRHLTSPIVAITSRSGDRANGMIANSSMRASLSADEPRLSVYVHKFNESHDMIFDSGAFALHLLHEGQLDLVYELGFKSIRDGDKLGAVPHRTGALGLPILEDCYAWFECRVANVMDAGGSTLFYGAVEHSGRGSGTAPMTPEFLRNAMPDERYQQYLAGIEQAQEWLRNEAPEMKAVVWRDLR